MAFVTSLYIHVPFCAHKCEYCAFYSAPPSGDQAERFVRALVRELELVAPHCRPQTVFFGGGTPTLLTLRQWETVIGAMDRLNLLGAFEWTVEANPATLSADKAKLLRSAGVNRISMGVQSLDEKLLDRLGRVHSRDMVFRSYDILRGAGFDNINIDLMFAIPTQTLATWNATLDEALALGTEHLSCYEVIYEEDTPLFHQLQAGKIDVDEALACTMYDTLIDRSTAAGFTQYEIANFARHARAGTPVAAPYPNPADGVPQFACRHNIGYWRGRDSYGLGPSASEYIGGVRARNWANTSLYCDQLEKGRRAKEFSEELAPLARAGELAAFGLRMMVGWRFDEFTECTGFDLREEWQSDMDELCRFGWAEITPEAFRLTRAGLRFADSAAAQMLRPTAKPETRRTIPVSVV
ncbi:MAG TPA: coproporphyrinogen-III oxidase family protein [Candidatus Limnocylindria bacterium]|jgi:oxygen-independent coproporphyrinogen-3 oxidase|nr:coproporphyrinogen-III oxidase family protein [Candidatus Limnocylindria bacterium]